MRRRRLLLVAFVLVVCCVVASVFAQPVQYTSYLWSRLGDDARFLVASVTRSYTYAGAKALTSGVATSVVSIGVDDTKQAGGVFVWTVTTADAVPNYQAVTGTTSWAAVNKSATEYCAVTGSGIGDPMATSGTDTLVCSVSCTTAGTNAVTLALDCTSSLTETKLDVSWSLSDINGTPSSVTAH